ncbi:HEPN domain-containing protein [Kosmotoga sp. DU53]|uniref:ApeA N-terminal domain 1-containing protein n=1 Tax=Kosmotoga sp. DU53 TaxID=1310160 RepID=UPI0007C523EB|nr:HEPN domain-containing protein [Kosmotoga sp. DU53]OAA19509.1 hypothetical protein DU53_10705 [Kosmotoga sp. DU53]
MERLQGRRIYGLWWFPQFSNIKYRGELYIEGESFFIKLFDDQKNFYNRVGDNIDVMLGESEEGRLSLRNGFVKNETTYHSGRRNFKAILLQFTEAYFGSHFGQNLETLESISIESKELSKWLGTYPFEYVKLSNYDKVIAHKNFKSVSAYVKSMKFKLEIHRLVSESSDETEATLKSIVSILITPDSPANIMWYKPIAKSIQNLLVLLIGGVVPFDRVSALQFFKQDDKEYPWTTEIYGWLRTPTANDINSHEIIVNLEDVRNKFDSIVNQWFVIEKELAKAVNLFVALFFNKHLYLESKFIILMQSIEAFHRQKFVGKLLPDDEFERVYTKAKEIIESKLKGTVSQDILERISQQLHYCNEYNLNKRLKEVLNSLPVSLRTLVTKNPKKFTHLIVNTRHDMTHPSNKSREKILKGEALVYANERLMLLCHILYLRELGVPDEIIRKGIVRAPTYRFLIEECPDNL